MEWLHTYGRVANKWICNKPIWYKFHSETWERNFTVTVIVEWKQSLYFKTESTAFVSHAFPGSISSNGKSPQSSHGAGSVASQKSGSSSSSQSPSAGSVSSQMSSPGSMYSGQSTYASPGAGSVASGKSGSSLNSELWFLFYCVGILATPPQHMGHVWGINRATWSDYPPMVGWSLPNT